MSRMEGMLGLALFVCTEFLSPSTPAFVEFFRLGATRVVLPLGNGSVGNLFVVLGYRDAEGDADQLALTDCGAL